MPVRKAIRTVIDVMLLAGFVVMLVTGLGLYFAPSGRIAREIGWTWLGLDKHTLGDVHAYFGFTMICVAIVHLTLNWKPLTSLLRSVGYAGIVKAVIAAFLILALVFTYATTIGR